MIRYTDESIFRSKQQALVNPVNCAGVMGAGLAKYFRLFYPEMFKEYRRDCRAGLYKLGECRHYETYDVDRGKKRTIVNFPTVYTLRPFQGATITEIQAGLIFLKNHLEPWKISTISIPALGCGIVGHNWFVIKGLLDYTFQDVPQDILIHNPKPLIS